MRNSQLDKDHVNKESPIVLGISGKQGGLEGVEFITCMLSIMY